MPFVPSPNVLSTDEMGRVAAPIFTSVGREGVNAPGDVFVIQGLLNDRLPKPHSPVPVTGITDIGTVLAIEAFQAVVMHMVPPSGRVDPGSPTYYTLAARPLVEAAPSNGTLTGHLGEVPTSIIDAAVASGLKWRIPVSVTIAQWAVESAWGASVPPDSNNPFGIKAAPGEPAVECPTREVVDGKSVVVTEPFRKFANLGEAFEAHGRLLASLPAYRPAMQKADDPDAFADALTGVYATDPQYGATLKFVIHTYGWVRYDKVVVRHGG
jgi:hypothetical protein